MNVLLLLAHHDDEYFIALRLREEIGLGNHVFVAYLTHGSIYRADPATRMRDSCRSLMGMGVRREDILMLGAEADIFDLKLCERMADAYGRLCTFMDSTRIGRLYVMAWEGGHPDHDAGHLIGAALARRYHLQQELYEFPAYSNFHVMRLTDDGRPVSSTATDRRQGLKTLCMGFGYAGQRRTFLVMLPGSLLQLVLIGHQDYRLVPVDRDYRQPPHAGKLFYERRYGLPFERFIEHANSFKEFSGAATDNA